jgi:hypothetical protein
MKPSIAIAATFVLQLVMSTAGVSGSQAAQSDCIATDQPGQTEIKNYPAGAKLVNTSYFLPAGGPVDVVLQEPYRPDASYFGRIESRIDNRGVGKSFVRLSKNAISAKAIPENHTLVKRGFADKSDTLLTINVPPEVDGLWDQAKLYIYACSGPSPNTVSVLDVPVSSTFWSTVIVIAGLFVVYLFAAVASKAVDPKSIPWQRYFDPVYMTAGSDGKGSLSKLQILFFSMIVFGLLAFIVLRTGVLSDISPTILALLGIAGVGSAAAKATDVQRNRLDFDNWAWFILKGWLPQGGLAAVNTAKWRDIVTSDGEFDVYRYQSCIFSLVVGSALLAAGINELASFTIPETLLGVLGLSQVVYVAGKLVAPPSSADLYASTKALRELERSSARPPPRPRIRPRRRAARRSARPLIWRRRSGAPGTTNTTPISTRRVMCASSLNRLPG